MQSERWKFHGPMAGAASAVHAPRKVFLVLYRPRGDGGPMIPSTNLDVNSRLSLSGCVPPPPPSAAIPRPRLLQMLQLTRATGCLVKVTQETSQPPPARPPAPPGCDVSGQILTGSISRKVNRAEASSCWCCYDASAAAIDQDATARAPNRAAAAALPNGLRAPLSGDLGATFGR
ncbi:unnamed protein product [Lampetra fluviatilis]